MDTDEERLNKITEKIIGCAFRVHNILGSGFSEKVYENALVHEVKKTGLTVEQQSRSKSGTMGCWWERILPTSSSKASCSWKQRRFAVSMTGTPRNV